MKKLVTWKTHTRRKPLILRGVRQTGKTFLLTEFGRAHFKSTHIINFEKQKNMSSLFDEDLDPHRIYEDLCFQLNTKIDVQEDLVIFDEIQDCPNALTSLKYFSEDLPELALCSAGSLLGLHLNEGSYPVGKVNEMHLYPMSFCEFLEGIGDDFATELMQNFKLGTTISDIKHERMWTRLKQYFITGGLPEVVEIFHEHFDNMYEATNLVRDKQDELITAYYSDIAKHAGNVNAMHIDRTWRSVPPQLASNYDNSTARFRFKEIMSGINRYRQIDSVLDWLDAAELVIRLPIVGAYEKPINAYTKDNFFKLMMFDVGILGAMSPIDPGKILKYDYGTYKGYFAENFVAQQMISKTKKVLYSWQEDRSEIEFLLQLSDNIFPVEVKSGKVTKAKSLEKYFNKYHPKRSVILSAHPPHTNRKNTVEYLPLYFAEKIPDLLTD